MQQRLDWSLPPSSDRTFRRSDVPISARSSIAGQCGASGREAVKLKAGSQAARVLAALQAGPKTDHELAAATGLPLTTVLARRWALIHKGLVGREPVGSKPHGEARNALWALTEKGTR